MKAPAAARWRATRAASFSGRPFSWARTPRSSSMPGDVLGQRPDRRTPPGRPCGLPSRRRVPGARAAGRRPDACRPSACHLTGRGRRSCPGCRRTGSRHRGSHRVSRCGIHRGSRCGIHRASRSATRRATTSCRGLRRTSHLVRRRIHLVTVAVLDGPRPQPHFPSPRVDTPFGAQRYSYRARKWRRGHQITGGPCQKRPPGWAASTQMYVRRRPTLPQPLGCSTIGAERLNFRVRYGTGCFPFAMAAVTLSTSSHPRHRGVALGLLVGNCLVDANSVCVRWFARRVTVRFTCVCFVRGWDKPSAY